MNIHRQITVKKTDKTSTRPIVGLTSVARMCQRPLGMTASTEAAASSNATPDAGPSQPTQERDTALYCCPSLVQLAPGAAPPRTHRPAPVLPLSTRLRVATADRRVALAPPPGSSSAPTDNGGATALDPGRPALYSRRSSGGGAAALPLPTLQVQRSKLSVSLPTIFSARSARQRESPGAPAGEPEESAREGVCLAGGDAPAHPDVSDLREVHQREWTAVQKVLHRDRARSLAAHEANVRASALELSMAQVRLQAEQDKSQLKAALRAQQTLRPTDSRRGLVGGALSRARTMTTRAGGPLLAKRTSPVSVTTKGGLLTGAHRYRGGAGKVLPGAGAPQGADTEGSGAAQTQSAEELRYRGGQAQMPRASGLGGGGSVPRTARVEDVSPCSSGTGGSWATDGGTASREQSCSCCCS